MLEIGDVIVHLRNGAGTVVGTRNFTRDGEERTYFCIEISENGSMLYIPQEGYDDSRLRYALNDIHLIETVMEKEPEILDDNHQTRHNLIEKKLKSSNPRQIVQVLRDLTWRKQTVKLTGTDERMRESALERLVNELNLSTSMSVEKLRSRINQIIDEAMSHHLARQGT